MSRLGGFPALALAGLRLNGLHSWVHNVVELNRVSRLAVVHGAGQARLGGRLVLGEDGRQLATHDYSVYSAPKDPTH